MLTTSYSFNIKCYQYPDGIEDYYLLVRPISPILFDIEAGMPFLVKFKDDSILELTNESEAISERTKIWLDNHYKSFYHTDIYYKIKENELDLFNKGIKKIRLFMNDNEKFEHEIRRDIISKDIIKQYNLIKEALKTENPGNINDYRKGF